MSRLLQNIFLVQSVSEFTPWNELPFFTCCDLCYYFIVTEYTYVPRCSAIYHIGVYDTLFMRSLHAWLKCSKLCSQLVHVKYHSECQTKTLYYTINSFEYTLHLLSRELTLCYIYLTHTYT